MMPTYGAVSILYPAFAPRMLCSLDLFARLTWWGPMHQGLVYTATT